MELVARPANYAAEFGLWLSQNTYVVRMALIVLPILLALGAALLTSGAVYACPASGGGRHGSWGW